MIMSALQKLLSVGDGQGKVNGGGSEHLSDDLVVEIVRRLPANQLWLSCRIVCKRWYALISSPFLFTHISDSLLPLSFFATNKNLCGLTIHENWVSFFLVMMMMMDRFSLKGNSNTGIFFEYDILTVDSTEWRRLCNLPYPVRPRSSPVVLDNALCWMIHRSLSTCEKSIIMFSMDGEKFSTLPHPTRRVVEAATAPRLRGFPSSSGLLVVVVVTSSSSLSLN
ncbi:hypothetical protein F3Y22_tig00111671pilonHSYRG00179 [Hibiscus syriacus]|uniref:F-box domain-containing protein n=1 Tax=Hibiscus syriacus TaxID=106335 RepID=A0A6A2XH98_HIBSY|nr:hypothetical protein F3Y22_tig00111671pilonHSYRG00179 [Hibiscus syriacus]